MMDRRPTIQNQMENSWLAFTSADIIFHKFSEIHSALSEKKKKIRLKFSFFKVFPQTRPPPHPSPTPTPLTVKIY